MELIDIDVIGFKKAKGSFKVFPEILRSFCGGFGRNEDFFANIGKSVSDFFFTVGICSCSIKKSHSAFKSAAENFY